VSLEKVQQLKTTKPGKHQSNDPVERIKVTANIKQIFFEFIPSLFKILFDVFLGRHCDRFIAEEMEKSLRLCSR
jgi:hypothetical protein